jgi:hypothetical protein
MASGDRVALSCSTSSIVVKNQAVASEPQAASVKQSGACQPSGEHHPRKLRVPRTRQVASGKCHASGKHQAIASGACSMQARDETCCMWSVWLAQSQLSQECVQTHLKRREHGDRGPSPQRQSLHRRNAARGHGVCPDHCSSRQ